MDAITKRFFHSCYSPCKELDIRMAANIAIQTDENDIIASCKSLAIALYHLKENYEKNSSIALKLSSPIEFYILGSIANTAKHIKRRNTEEQATLYSALAYEIIDDHPYIKHYGFMRTIVYAEILKFGECDVLKVIITYINFCIETLSLPLARLFGPTLSLENHSSITECYLSDKTFVMDKLRIEFLNKMYMGNLFGLAHVVFLLLCVNHPFRTIPVSMPDPQCNHCIHEPKCWVPITTTDQARCWQARCKRGHRVHKSVYAPGLPAQHLNEQAWVSMAE
ncbi:hypothetical protein V6C53_04965 [Desulfocurvibacter africanus]|uniref:hypothetical protein n=1 Tax=Desulfocurvibacter africanus TaxID=873 RepID=UPI002FDAF412